MNDARNKAIDTKKTDDHHKHLRESRVNWKADEKLRKQNPKLWLRRMRNLGGTNDLRLS